MRLNRFTDYSLRVLIYVAAAPDGHATIGEIARAFRISEHHLVKVVHFLGRHGYLENSRGRKGGLRLARVPRDINIGAVVRLTEGDDMPAECFNEETNTCVLAGGCGLQKALGEAVRSFYAALGRYSLADLYLRPRKLTALFQLRAA